MNEAMAAPKMHADEIDTDVALVRRLLTGQFPQWAGLAIDPVESYGTDHDIYRLGDHLAARLPRIGWAIWAYTPRAAPRVKNPKLDGSRARRFGSYRAGRHARPPSPTHPFGIDRGPLGTDRTKGCVRKPPAPSPSPRSP
jgi:hypothetical protein